jgi:hypothetical protein
MPPSGWLGAWALSTSSVGWALMLLSVCVTRALALRRVEKRPSPTGIYANPRFVNNPDPLFGKHKWLGGSYTADKSSIIGIPSHAKRVIKIHPATGAISTFGGPFVGQFKWLRGVLAKDNCIYGIPAHATSVLKINPATEEVEELGVLPEGQWKWHGASLAIDCIYAVPCNAQSVLKIIPATGEVTQLDIPAHANGGQKWYGTLVGRDGCVYGIPYKAHGVVKVNPFNDKVSILGDFGDSDFKWHGGAVGPDGCVYGFPAHAATVLKISPHIDDAQVGLEELHLDPLEDPQVMQGKYKWLGGGVDREGNIYGMPSDAQTILKIETSTGRVSTFGSVSDDKNKWQGAVLGPDGCLYAMPANACTVLKINPYTMEIKEIGNLPKQKDKFQGGFVGGDGKIYAIPEMSQFVMRLDPATEEITLIDSSAITTPETLAAGVLKQQLIM